MTLYCSVHERKCVAQEDVVTCYIEDVPRTIIYLKHVACAACTLLYFENLCPPGIAAYNFLFEISERDG
jgi:hypothetical protein